MNQYIQIETEEAAPGEQPKRITGGTNGDKPMEYTCICAYNMSTLEDYNISTCNLPSSIKTEITIRHMIQM